ncbi:MAG TPA: hypothetical protein PLL53_07335, partial [Saprospiraceae bacterium]|nr:hypothetical protein [Saprospiraceae bacterium]
MTENTPVTPSLPSIGPFCTGASPTALSTTLSGITGSWSGPGVSGNSFNPATAGAGSHTLTFTPNADQCANMNTMMVTVNSNATPTFTQVPDICSGGSFSLPTTSDNGI